VLSILAEAIFTAHRKIACCVSCLKAGFSPREILFLDGINERCSIGTYQKELKELFVKAQNVYGWRTSDIVTPVIYLTEQIRLKYLGKKDKKENFDLVCQSYGVQKNFQIYCSKIYWNERVYVNSMD
jgi:hypothetical protein